MIVECTQAQTRENGIQVINPHVWLISIPMAHIHFFELEIELTLQYCGPYLHCLVKPYLSSQSLRWLEPHGQIAEPAIKGHDKLEGDLKLEFEKMADHFPSRQSPLA